MRRWHHGHHAVDTRVADLPSFHQCVQCDYNIATGEGQRGCHLYECPYLPELLDVRCPTCLYNFYMMDGNAGCGDPPRCEFARNEAPKRVAAVTEWLVTG